MSDWEDDMYDDEEEEVLSFEDEDDEMNEDDDNEDGNNNNGNNSNNSNNDNNGDNGGCIDDNMKNNFESLYFKAKYLKEEDKFEQSIELFNSIIRQTDQSSDYVFKSIKQLIKIYEYQKNVDVILDLLDKMFLLKKNNQVDESYFNSSISKMVQRIDTKNYDDSFSCFIFDKIYNYLTMLSPDKMDVSTLKLKIKLELIISNNFIKSNDFKSASKYLNNLEALMDHATQSIKNTFYLDIIANKILIILNDNPTQHLKELRRLSILANSLISGIPQTKILGIINEGSGLVAMYSSDFKTANKYFQNSFKNFNDSGDHRRNDVLIKFIVSSILSKSEVNPFQSSDFQGFLKNETVNLLMEMYGTFHDLNVKAFNKLVKSEAFRDLLESHKFVKDFVSKLSECIYSEFIINQLPLFEKVRFEYFTKRLDVSMIDFKQFLLKLYGKGLIDNCKVDYVERYIIYKRKTKFINITFNKFIQNAFMYYDLSNSSNFDNFLTQVTNMEKDKLMDNHNYDISDDVKEEIEEKTAREINEGPFGDDTMLNARKENINHYFFQQMETLPIDIDVTTLNRNVLHQDIKYMKFDTICNIDNLSYLTHKLYVDNIFQKDLSRSVQSRSNVQEYVQQYLTLLETSIPHILSQNISYVSQVKDLQTNTEFQKLFPKNPLPPPPLSSLSTSTKNIPDILQQSSMQPLIPINPDAVTPTEITPQERLVTISHTLDTLSRIKQTSHARHPNFTGTVPRRTTSVPQKIPLAHQTTRNFPIRARISHNSPSETETTSLENENFSIDENESY